MVASGGSDAAVHLHSSQWYSTLFTNLSYNINKSHNEHAAPPPLRNTYHTQLEEVTRRLAAAFNDVHQLCLQEIEKTQQAQQIEQEVLEEAEEVD